MLKSIISKIVNMKGKKFEVGDIVRESVHVECSHMVILAYYKKTNIVQCCAVEAIHNGRFSNPLYVYVDRDKELTLVRKGTEKMKEWLEDHKEILYEYLNQTKGVRLRGRGPRIF